ncbi:hypothetical protein CR513_59649, partial [Mucuna pruriens]
VIVGVHQGSKPLPKLPDGVKGGGIELENRDRLMLKYFVDENIIQELWRLWKNVVTVKLLIKILLFIGGFKVADVDHSFYTVKCDIFQGREEVISC